MVRARRKGAPKSWIGTKISGTIVEFGLPLIEQLPPGPSRRLCEQTFELVIMIWNAHVLARFWGEPQHLASLKNTLRNAVAEGVLPIDALDEFEMLSARRQQPPFVDDPRAVGHWELRETAAGEWNLHCDARLPPS
jgi:hypothetical protein